MSSFPHYLQLDSMDCGPSCLRMIAKYYGRSYTLQTLRDLSFITREGVSMLGISDAAESIGMHTQGVRVTLEQLVNDIPLPCILHYNQNHFVVLYKIKGKSSRVQKLLGKANSDSHLSTPNFQFFIADPAGQKYVMDSGEFTRCWYSGKTNGKDIGTALLLSPSPDFYNYEDDRDKQKKNLGFYFRYLIPYKSQYAQIVLGMITGSIFALIFPFLTLWSIRARFSNTPTLFRHR